MSDEGSIFGRSIARHRSWGADSRTESLLGPMRAQARKNPNVIWKGPEMIPPSNAAASPECLPVNLNLCRCRGYDQGIESALVGERSRGIRVRRRQPSAVGGPRVTRRRQKLRVWGEPGVRQWPFCSALAAPSRTGTAPESPRQVPRPSPAVEVLRRARYDEIPAMS